MITERPKNRELNYPAKRNQKICPKHNDLYDEEADKWLYPKCPSQSCRFCVDRPERHSQVTDRAKYEEKK